MGNPENHMEELNLEEKQLLDGESFIELTDGTRHFVSPQLSKALERKFGFRES